jgi:hypothetical protein
VTSADRVAFAQAFNRLAVATRLPAGEADGAMQQIYWDGLQELPVEVVTTAACLLAYQATWFPKLAEWRAAAYREQLESVLRVPTERGPWQDECDACGDTGWMLFHCVPGTDTVCDRPACRDHVPGRYPHDYVRRCPCRPTNHTFHRHNAVRKKNQS